MSELRRLISRSFMRHGAGLVALAVGLLLAASVSAQTLTNSFGGLSKSSKDPIDIESDVLVVHDSQKYATFKGNVKAVQGTTTLRARELNVHYTGGGDKLIGGQDKKDSGEQVATETKVADAKDGKGGSSDSGTQITKIVAKGDVVITSENDQTTSSEWAIYDVPTQQVTVGGNVVLTQGKNVLKGDRLVIDLKTGESRFENTGNTAVAGGRIRALFMPKEKADTAKSGDAASGQAEGTAPVPVGEPSATSQPAGEGDSTDTSASAAPKSAEPADSPWQIVPGVAQ
jgi:lipopolysaccharide export system protein LptA